MVSITRALRQIKENLASYLEPARIEALCRGFGHTWRGRILDPVTTLHLFILQILHGNTACSHLAHLTGPLQPTLSSRRPFTASAYCQARRRLPIEIAALAIRMADACPSERPAAHLWHGHRTVLIDGSGFSMPIVADRGFCSYAHLGLILQGNMHACLRVHQKQIVSFRPHRRHAAGKKARGLPRARWLCRLGVCDQLLEWPRPAQRPTWMSQEAHAALPESITLRELKYKVGPRGFRVREVTLVTTLLDAETYPASELAELYRRRWEVETNLRHLKNTLGMDTLHCKTVDGVVKEMWMFVLVYNLVRHVMLEAARHRGVEPHRVSFIDAARWLVRAVFDPDAEYAVSLTSLIVNPSRDNRIEPRVIKRRMKEYLLMKKPRDQLRQDLLRGKLVA